MVKVKAKLLKNKEKLFEGTGIIALKKIDELLK